jgi:hypothetical protein
VRIRGAVLTPGAGVAARDATSAASAIAPGTACATRHDSQSVTTPTAGLTTIHASALAPATYPIAHDRRSCAKAVTPAKPADSRHANPSPTSACAARNRPSVGEAATAAQPASAMAAPSLSSRDTPSASIRDVIAAAVANRHGGGDRARLTDRAHRRSQIPADRDDRRRQDDQQRLRRHRREHERREPCLLR